MFVGDRFVGMSHVIQILDQIQQGDPQAAAAEAIRHFLVDIARRKGRKKREA